MSGDILLWGLLWIGLTGLLLVLPFYPTWREWARPRDHESWPLPAEVLGLSEDPRKAAPRASLHLATGARFTRLEAGTVVLGSGHRREPSAHPALQPWTPPPGARPWGEHGWHLGQGLHIAGGQAVEGMLVVRGVLRMDGPGRVDGDVKASEGLHLGADCQVRGHLFSEGDIEIGPDAHIQGVVMAEGHLRLWPGVVIGTPGQPVSVCAGVITAHGPVRIHGTVHARQHGEVAAPPKPFAISSTVSKDMA